jgi:hypothetical protein
LKDSNPTFRYQVLSFKIHNSKFKINNSKYLVKPVSMDDEPEEKEPKEDKGPDMGMLAQRK